MLITPEKALKTVLSSVEVLKPRRMALGGALNLILAEDIRSDRDQPPKDRSAMDGYAVMAADVQQVPARLKLIGEIAAGSPAVPRVKPGTCATILTGANLPPGADAVVQVENTEADDSEVIVYLPVEAGQNVRRRGEEACRGTVLLEKGTQIGPVQMGVCAMVGKAQVKVHPRPKVVVVCTGGEVKDAAERVGVHQLRDSNGPALLASLDQHGWDGVRRWIVPDNPRTITARLKRLLNTHQVIILTGGVSVGQYDYVPQAVQSAGGKIRFHGVSMKPGKPQLYATVGRNQHIFGLPGNPVSVLTGFNELLLPGLRRMSGVSDEAVRPAMVLPLAELVRSKGRRTYFCLARLVRMEDALFVEPVKSKGSADLIAASQADGVIVIPFGAEQTPAGTMVEFHPWRPLA